MKLAVWNLLLWLKALSLEPSIVAESLAESAQPGTFCCGWKCSAWNLLLWLNCSAWTLLLWLNCSAWNLLLWLKVLSLEPSTVAELLSLEPSTLAESAQPGTFYSGWTAQPGTFYCSWKWSAWNLLLWLKVLSLEPSTLAESAQPGTIYSGWTAQPGTFYSGWTAQPGTFYSGWKRSAWNLLLWLKVLNLAPSTVAESTQPGTVYCDQPFPRAAPQCPQGCASALGWPGQGGCRSAEWPPEAIQHKPLLTGQHGLQNEPITQANRQPVTAADLTSTTNETSYGCELSSQLWKREK